MIFQAVLLGEHISKVNNLNLTQAAVGTHSNLYAFASSHAMQQEEAALSLGAEIVLGQSVQMKPGMSLNSIAMSAFPPNAGIRQRAWNVI